MLQDMDLEMFSDFSEEDRDSTMTSPVPDATDCIEELVASFLFQLSRSPEAKSTDSDSEDVSMAPAAKPAPLELHLVDRQKEGALRTMRFPKKRATGISNDLHRPNAAQLFKVLDLMHEAIIDDIPTTKRDMYYKDVPLFKKQRVVDNLVDDIAATLELDRADLNVVSAMRATSKGLVCGSGLSIHLQSGEDIRVTDTEGAVIPVGEDIKSFTVAEDLAWVLIVEKDAVFQTLCRVRFASHAGLPGRGLIITGKGYPDVATRQLVATLSACLPQRIPLLGLVDGDPYGIDILSVYKFGSRAMAHETDKLAAPRVKYLGVLASELASYGVDRDALLPISKADEKKALTMLTRPIPAKWRRELSHMLHARRKAEIEVLASAALPSTDEQMSQQSDSGTHSTERSTPSTDSALVRYLVTKIRSYVERAALRD